MAVLLAVAGFCGSYSPGSVRGAEPAPHRVPVIFDTDIGDDIDDTWALALLLRCPELDVKELCVMEGLGLRVTDKGHTVIDGTARRVQVATGWKDLNGFHDFLVTRLTSIDPAKP